MKYFNDCTTIEEVKRTYKELVKRLHPDNGGSCDAFAAMKNEYEAAFNRCKNVHTRKDGTTYTKETAETPEMFAAVIDALINLDGLTLEIIGGWLWVSGNTYPNKEAIKAAGCMWSKTRKMWFWNGEDRKTRRGSNKTMDELKGIYGCQTMKSKGTAQIAASKAVAAA